MITFFVKLSANYIREAEDILCKAKYKLYQGGKGYSL